MAFTIRSAVVALSLLSLAAGGIERDLGDREIADALAVARSSTPRARRAFHTPYVIPLTAAPIQRLSVVTEFRRVVLLAEDRLRLGDHAWGLREARSALQPWRHRLEVVADVVFHPMTALVTVPAYDVLLVPDDGAAMKPLATSRTAKYGLQPGPTDLDPSLYPWPPPTVPVAPGAEPLTGAWVSAAFDATRLNPQGRVEIVVFEGAKELARQAVDLGAIR